MADRVSRRLAAIEAAADASRWKLLAHAVEKGAFLAADAATIASLPSKSGNARSTHADRLWSVKLLKREDRPVRYEATVAGKDLYLELKAIVARDTALATSRVELAPGDHIEVVAQLAHRSKRAVALRITRET